MLFDFGSKSLATKKNLFKLISALWVVTGSVIERALEGATSGLLLTKKKWKRKKQLKRRDRKWNDDAGVKLCMFDTKIINLCVFFKLHFCRTSNTLEPVEGELLGSVFLSHCAAPRLSLPLNQTRKKMWNSYKLSVADICLQIL